MPDCVRAKPFVKREVIELEDSLFTSLVAPISKAKRQGQGHSLAAQVTTVPGLKLKYAKRERQNANRREADRKSKSRFDSNVPIIHFQVGVGHCKYNKNNEEYWEACQSTISIDELNCELTFKQLKHSILMQA